MSGSTCPVSYIVHSRKLSRKDGPRRLREYTIFERRKKRLSTEYYISNRRKREEILAFNRFWEEKLIPGIKEQINEYCGEANGIHVNMGFAERVMEDEISKICHAPGDSQSYETALGSSRSNGKRTLFQWEGSYVDDHIIRDEGSLVDFFSHQANQDHYCIVDEHGTEYSIEDFLKKIKYSGA